jgi:hypothetical protein
MTEQQLFEEWLENTGIQVGDLVLVAHDVPEDWWDRDDCEDEGVLGRVWAVSGICRTGRQMIVLENTLGTYVPYWCLVRVEDGE